MIKAGDTQTVQSNCYTDKVKDGTRLLFCPILEKNTFELVKPQLPAIPKNAFPQNKSETVIVADLLEEDGDLLSLDGETKRKSYNKIIHLPAVAKADTFIMLQEMPSFWCQNARSDRCWMTTATNMGESRSMKNENILQNKKRAIVLQFLFVKKQYELTKFTNEAHILSAQ